ncbi:Hypothetical protein FKW44_000677, partial [Caligus rogercresseyi]
DQNEWHCEFCNKSHGSKSALKTHINALHADELGASWTCQICYKALSSKTVNLPTIGLDDSLQPPPEALVRS